MFKTAFCPVLYTPVSPAAVSEGDLGLRGDSVQTELPGGEVGDGLLGGGGRGAAVILAVALALPVPLVLAVRLALALRGGAGVDQVEAQSVGDGGLLPIGHDPCLDRVGGAHPQRFGGAAGARGAALGGLGADRVEVEVAPVGPLAVGGGAGTYLGGAVEGPGAVLPGDADQGEGLGVGAGKGALLAGGADERDGVRTGRPGFLAPVPEG
ncbi:hypothetical protein [Streptomyces sp. NPDC047453]|uniref:hypothetical protein n=1 Tax=Streptomyces sp. NPDC047453 TaxID=3154812 RepID=UPI0033C08CC7